jgi:hypothetical protein
MRRIEREHTNRHFSEFSSIKKLSSYDIGKIIFIHIPKTGGKSIAASCFNGMCNGRVHASIRSYISNFRGNLSEYYKFSVIRDPVDRMSSLYYFTKQRNKGGSWNDKIHGCKSFEQFCERLEEIYNDNAHCGLLPQSFWITDVYGRIAVDEIFDFRKIECVFAKISTLTGAECRYVHTNKSNNPSGDSAPDWCKEIIRSFYRSDVILYNACVENGGILYG